MFEFIKREKASCDVRVMCRLLKVSPSGYYGWRSRPLCPRKAEDAVLCGLIHDIYERSRRTYGYPRIRDDLAFDHQRCHSRKRVLRLMRQLGIRGAHRRRRGKRGGKRSINFAPAPDLVNRSFVANRPDELYVADIKYVWTVEGWLYLAGVKDVFTRQMVGWAMSNRLDSSIVVDAVKMAVW